MEFLRFLDSVADTSSAASSTPSGMQAILQNLTMPLLLVGMIVVMYFVMIRPQRKREKEAKMMRNALAVGDEIVTIGGISGIVINVREDSVIIESGSDKDKLKIMKWAIQSITQLRDTSTEIEERSKENKETAKLKDKDSE